MGKGVGWGLESVAEAEGERAPTVVAEVDEVAALEFLRHLVVGVEEVLGRGLEREAAPERLRGGEVEDALRTLVVVRLAAAGDGVEARAEEVVEEVGVKDDQEAAPIPGLDEMLEELTQLREVLEEEKLAAVEEAGDVAVRIDHAAIGLLVGSRRQVYVCALVS